MNTLPSSVSVWRSGRLARQSSSRPVGLGRDYGLAAALLAVAAVVLTLFVSVLERDMDRSEILHEQQRVRSTPPVAVYELRTGERVPDTPPQEPVDAQ